MTDEAVLSVQKWLNKTYSGISGYDKAPENGSTGWPTIYSLREGLQHELGISPVSEGFGPQTKAALSLIVDQLKVGYKTKPNITKLIKGAFWCKGISPVDFTTTYGSEVTSAFINLQSNAGITSDGVVTINLMAALFDMSAFTLVNGGKTKVRLMQQWLNKQYSDILGILPCDGIYQRETNTALIYALQRAEGMAADVANGIYGPGTIEKCPILSQGDSGDAVRILQYGLLVNGYENDVNGIFSSNTGDLVARFSTDMNLEPITGRIAGNRIFKGLLTTNGDTTRDSIACDTSRQLSAADIAILKSYGFSIVGRYLTGSVGIPGTPKNLSVSEISSIVNGGMSVFPIYQDGGAVSGYFTNSQGYVDGLTAVSTARRLGFAPGTTIYFACDVDLQEGEISSTILSYMDGVNSAFSSYIGNEYKIGIYGTRNVCTHVLKQGFAVHCFVSDMSTGYSGNLGYAMPQKWSFDQFVEYSIGGIPIDQVATDVNISDQGCKKFTPGELTEYDKKLAVLELVSNIMPTDIISLEWNREYPLYNVNGLTTTWSASMGNDQTGSAVKITNGKFDTITLEKLISPTGVSNEKIVEEINNDGIASIGSQVSDGAFSVSTSAKTDGSFVTDVSLHVDQLKEMQSIGNDLKVDITLKFTITIRPDFWDHVSSLLPKSSREPAASFLGMRLATPLGGYQFPTEAGILALIALFISAFLTFL